MHLDTRQQVNYECPELIPGWNSSNSSSSSSKNSSNKNSNKYDDILQSGLTMILNVSLNEDQWLQASLVTCWESRSGIAWFLRCSHLLPIWHQLHLQSSFNS